MRLWGSDARCCGGAEGCQSQGTQGVVSCVTRRLGSVLRVDPKTSVSVHLLSVVRLLFPSVLAEFEAFVSAEEAASAEHVSARLVQRPVVAFAWASRSSWNFDEAIVEGQVVPNGVLPSLLVVFVVRKSETQTLLVSTLVCKAHSCKLEFASVSEVIFQVSNRVFVFWQRKFNVFIFFVRSTLFSFPHQKNKFCIALKFWSHTETDASCRMLQTLAIIWWIATSFILQRIDLKSRSRLSLSGDLTPLHTQIRKFNKRQKTS